ncbi:hypothetical protein A4G85_12035 [Burkholderia pseudomallei]|nr:hypothetical protein A4G85_12035 [Burkholderia pseudomallei]
MISLLPHALVLCTIGFQLLDVYQVASNVVIKQLAARVLLASSYGIVAAHERPSLLADFNPRPAA